MSITYIVLLDATTGIKGIAFLLEYLIYKSTFMGMSQIMVDKIRLQFPAIESVTPIRMGGAVGQNYPPLCCGVH